MRRGLKVRGRKAFRRPVFGMLKLLLLLFRLPNQTGWAERVQPQELLT